MLDVAKNTSPIQPSEKHSRQRKVICILGFASLLIVMDFLMWGGAFLGRETPCPFTIEQRRLYYTAPLLLSLGTTMVVCSFCVKPTLAYPDESQTTMRVLSIAGCTGISLGIAFLWLASALPSFFDSQAILPIVAICAGTGIALMLLSWQSSFISLCDSELVCGILGACMIFPLIAIGAMWFPSVLAFLVTICLCLVSCTSLHLLQCKTAGADRADDTALPHQGGAAMPHIGLRQKARPKSQSQISTVRNQSSVLLCMIALALITGISRTLSIHAAGSTEMIYPVSLISIFVCAIVLFALWRIPGAHLSPITLYKFVFPLIALLIIIFFVFENDFTYMFASCIYFFFEIELIMVMMHYARQTRERRLHSPTLATYGVVAGSAYIALFVGTILGHLIQRGSATISTFAFAVIVCIYVLTIPLTFQFGKQTPTQGIDDGTDLSHSAINLQSLAREYGLSPREEEVTSLLLTGQNSREIANALNLSDNTVRTHKKNIFRKLGVHSLDEIHALIDQDTAS